jgi:prepilin-type N-terminal cleavage/methylation domain-containing protein
MADYADNIDMTVDPPRPAACGTGPRISPQHGFTLVELAVVLACIAVAAMLVVPVLGNTAATELKAAAQLLIADLEHAQTESITHADDPRVFVVDPSGTAYHIAARSDPATPVINTVGAQPYRTAFGVGRAGALRRTRIHAYAFDGTPLLRFGSLGQLAQSTPATITLACGTLTLTITIDPITGEAAVGQIH